MPHDQPADLEWGKPAGGGGPGESYATRRQIIWTSVFNIVMALLVFHGLVALWPYPTPAMVAPEDEQTDTVTVARTDTVAPAQAAGRPAPAPETLATRVDTPAAPTDTTPGGSRPSTGPAPGAAPPAGEPSAGQRGARQLVPGYLWCDRELQQGWAAVYAGKEPGTDHEKIDPKCVRVLGVAFPISDEQRLLLLVLLAGALGGMIHVLRSIAWYVGNRELVRSWLPRYYLIPLTGAAMGVVIYVLLRGGFFASTSSVGDTSPFGFVAIAVLAGLFSEQFVLKLQDLSETLLTRPKSGADPAPPQNPTRPRGRGPDGGGPDGGGPDGGGPDGGAPPALAITRDPTTDGTPSRAFTVKASGFGFVPDSKVRVGATAQPFTLISETELRFELAEIPPAGSRLKVEVSSPDGQKAAGEIAV